MKAKRILATLLCGAVLVGSLAGAAALPEKIRQPQKMRRQKKNK